MQNSGGEGQEKLAVEKCHYCGKDLDPTKPHIEVEGVEGKKKFCHGPVSLSDNQTLPMPDEKEKVKVKMSELGLCSHVYKMQQLMDGHPTENNLVEP